MEWRVQAIRGATTVSENSIAAMREAILELLEELERRNPYLTDRAISVIFSATPDLDAIFPAAIARELPQWQNIALLDVQHMYVRGSLERCIRLLIHANLPTNCAEVRHTYLREAQHLRPDLAVRSH